MAPAELEALLLTHPKIGDAAVIGVYDDDNNEVPHAFVVRQPGAEELSAGEVMSTSPNVSPPTSGSGGSPSSRECRGRSGKILRRQLRERS